MKRRIFLVLFIIIISGQFSLAQDNENFNSFLFQFASNKEFQLSRIKFPLEYKTWDNPTEIGGEVVVKYIKAEDWEHDYFYLNEYARPQIFDNFKGELRDTDERLFQWIGVETGVNVKYFFKRIDGDWFLIKKENLGD